MKVLIGNGHGIETLGKRSPDGRLREYAYTREVADRVVKTLTAAGIDAVRIVPEDADVRRVASRLYSFPFTAMQPVTVLHGCRHMVGASL